MGVPLSRCDKHGQTPKFMLSEHRDHAAAMDCRSSGDFGRD